MDNRFSLIVAHLGLSLLAFAKSINVSHSSLFPYLKEGRLPSTKIVQKIAEIYPQFNVEWIVTGKGEMLRHKFEQTYTKQCYSGNSTQKTQAMETTNIHQRHGDMLKPEICINQGDNNLQNINDGTSKTIEQLLEQSARKDEQINSLLNELSEMRKENTEMRKEYSKLIDILLKK